MKKWVVCLEVLRVVEAEDELEAVMKAYVVEDEEVHRTVYVLPRAEGGKSSE